MRSARVRCVCVCVAVALGVVLVPGLAAAALPTVGVNVTTSPLTNTTAHTGVTVTASCASGSTLVGGGAYDDVVANPATLPTNGLVMGGTSPSTGSSPVDTPAANGATNPSHWFGIANFTGVADPAGQDQAKTFALCAQGGPQSTVVETTSTTGANATQQVNPPVLTIATCPAGSTLIGGGAITNGAGQVNDGTTAGNSGNLKPMGSYPSTATGVAAANGSTGATSWTAYGASGIPASSDVVTSLALCSTDSGAPPVQVARTDFDGPSGQTGTTVTVAGATCASGTQMLGGGYSVDQTVGSTSGLQPQQGWHMRGSFPATSAITGYVPTTYPTDVANGASDPQTWEALMQAGGQSLPAGDTMNLHAYAMCATAPALASPTISSAASPSVTTGGQISDSATLTGGTSPTGTITFTLYGPGDGSCSTPLTSSTATVAGNGTYPSAPYTANTVGTYQWIASYGGDPENNPIAGSCGASGESVAVTAPAPGVITGTVTNGSGTPLSNICVYPYAPGPTGARTTDAGSCTNSQGQYALTIATAGSYNVVFYDPSGAYLTQWYSGVSSESAATAVTVTNNALTTGINAKMTQQTEITGTVTNGSGTPLSNICVYLYASGATGARTGDTGTCTASNGTYAMPISSAGSYNVVFVDPSGAYLTQWYSGASSEAAATAVTVTAGAPTTGINATMAEPTEITGTVSNGSGTPLANICVYLYGSGASGARTGDTGTCTNASGTYAMPVAAAGSYNVVFYDPTGTYLTQWYSGAPSEATATPVTVTSGVPTTGINATMGEPTAISGTVTNGSGTPLANICVYLYASGASGARTGDAGTCTNAAGQYSMAVGSPGSYNVVFYDPSGTYLTQWYNGAASEAAATTVTVSSGAPTTGINATMTKPTQITGTVTNASGTPLSNICVYLYASGATGARTGDTGTCTNAAGQYTMAVAAPGSYNVVFYDPSGTYLSQWYNAKASEATANPVTVTSGATTSGINAAMQL